MTNLKEEKQAGQAERGGFFWVFATKKQIENVERSF